MLNTPEFPQPAISPVRQLFYLLLICVGCIFAGMVGVDVLLRAIYGFDVLEEMLRKSGAHPAAYLSAFRWFLGLGNTVIGFLAPALLFAFVVVRQPDGYLRYRNRFPVVLLGLVFLFMLFFFPVVQITGYYNEQLSLPQALKPLERWIRNSEEANQSLIKQVMVMKTSGDLIISLIIVAVLPAIAEEFLFRGCLQTIFRRWNMSIHASVWIAAAIFSFIHFEFLGFVPRMLLGAALGYMFAYSGSIWPAVFGHFLNNAGAVIGYYMYQHHKLEGDPDKWQPTTPQLWIYLLCALTAVWIMLFYQRYAAKKTLIYGEALD